MVVISRKNSLNTEIHLQSIKFFVKLTKFSVKSKIKAICKSFALPRGRKSFVDHFDFPFDEKFENMCICYRNFFTCSYLVNYIAIVFAVQWESVTRHSVTVWKNEKFTLTQNFSRQNSYLVILLVKPLLSRNFHQKCVIWERISVISTLCIENLLTLIWRKI